MPKLKFFLGKVTNGDGATLETEGYITYGESSEPDAEVGEIEIRGQDAAKIAERICQLLNE